MSGNRDPLYALMGTLLETWEQRYTFEHDTRKQTAVFSRGEMTANVDVSDNRLLRVVYFSAPNQQTSELCTPAEAAVLIEAILFRDNLCKVPKPEGRKPWWKSFLG